MDKFLAKKSAIFNKVIYQNQFIDTQAKSSKSSDGAQEFQIVKSILQLCLKSMYEQLRSFRISSNKTFYQLFVDVYFLDVSCVFMSQFLFSGQQTLEFDPDCIIYKEENSNLSGLINEIVCTGQQRMKSKPGTLDEQLMLTVCEMNLQKLFQPNK